MVKDVTGIYKITSPTGKVYIGQGVNINKRWNSYKRYNCKSQTKLYQSFLRHTPEAHSFEILHTLPNDVNKGIMDIYEQFYMDQFKESGYSLLNVSPTSGGSMRGFKHSDETKRKMSESRKGKTTTSEKQRAIIIECNKTRTKSEATRKKISDSRKGIVPWNKGVTHGNEARIKISKALKGRKRKPFTAETRLKMSLASKGRQAFLGKKHTEETKRKAGAAIAAAWKRKKLMKYEQSGNYKLPF